MKKSLFVRALVLVMALSLLLLGGCSAGASAVPKVGVIQFMDHPSLNEIRDAFTAELAAKGYGEGKVELIVENGQGDFTNLNSIAQKLVGEKVDLIVAIATPSAQAAAAATTNIPILFSAVTDPVEAGLVADLNAPGGNITGTSDAIPVDSIFQLAGRLTPTAKSFGFIYNSGETNSVSVIKQAKAYCDQNGLSYTEATVTTSGEVQQAALQLLSKSDALFAPIDNTVASAMTNLSDLCIQQNKPVYVAADSMVNDGGLATVGINYTNLGKETAAMAVELLGGKKPADLPVRTLSDFAEVINPDTAKALGISIEG